MGIRRDCSPKTLRQPVGPGTNEFPNRSVLVLLGVTMREELLRERKGAGRDKLALAGSPKAF